MFRRTIALADRVKAEHGSLPRTYQEPKMVLIDLIEAVAMKATIAQADSLTT